MHRKHLIFILSPVPWVYHNNKIQIWGEIFSRRRTVVYLDTFSNDTYTLKNLINRRFIKKIIAFYSSLVSKRTRLITNPIIITIHAYGKGYLLGRLDQVLLLIQIYIWTFLLRGKVMTIAYTSYFPPILKYIPSNWIYDFFDRMFFPGADGTEKQVRSNEVWLIKKSRVVFYASDHYAKFLTSLERRYGFVIAKKKIPLGYDIKDFLYKEYKGDLKEKNKLIVGYAGGISDRIDYELVLNVVSNNPEIHFLFVGPIFSESWFLHPTISSEVFIKELKKKSNVSIITPKEFTKKVSAYLRTFTIGWIPYDKKLQFNMYSHPSKFVEYTALGEKYTQRCS